MLTYLGLMTGTSVDSFMDVSALTFADDQSIITRQHLAVPLPITYQQQWQQLSAAPLNTITQAMLQTNNRLFTDFLIEVVPNVIEQLDLKDDIILSPHGITIYHYPFADPPMTHQLLEPQRLADHLKLTVCADHRLAVLKNTSAAPLAPAFVHAILRQQQQPTLLINGGGIANFCYYTPSTKRVIGYDTGPANGPIDSVINHIIKTDPAAIPNDLVLAIKQHQHDPSGQFAARGTIHEAMLHELLAHPYFTKPNHEKSADRADFGLQWVLDAMQRHRVLLWQDCLATVVECIAISMTNAIRSYITDTTLISFYGGIVHNDYLMQRIYHHFDSLPLQYVPIERWGFHPDYFESDLMAWLAMRVHHKLPIDLSYIARPNCDATQELPGKLYYATQ